MYRLLLLVNLYFSAGWWKGIS